MSDAAAPYQGMNPNSEHQMWSRWTFGIQAARKRPDVPTVLENARKYFAAGFKTHSGRVRCQQSGAKYMVIVEVEGPPAHDPSYVAAVKQDFRTRFMWPGFGYAATLVVFEVGVLAGNKQDGRPPDQLLVLPQLDLPPELRARFPQPKPEP